MKSPIGIGIRSICFYEYSIEKKKRVHTLSIKKYGPWSKMRLLKDALKLADIALTIGSHY